MIKQGMFVRCPIDRQHPSNPRLFATGKVVSINEFNETAHIVFQDPFNHIEYFDYIPPEVEEAPLSLLDHCHLFKGSLVKIGHRTAQRISKMEELLCPSYPNEPKPLQIPSSAA